jgi:4-aminobutyrate aminotransferase/(S)-3-amino-2-methylpropionate transaminase
MGSIATMEELNLAQRARELGALMVEKLSALAAEFDVIAEIRGRGAMVAIEFAEPGTLEPLPALPKAIAARCAQEGVVILTAGTFGNVIRLLPPLVISDELLAEGLDVLAAALAAEIGV